MKSTDNLGRRGLLVWNAIRPILPRRFRWYYEGHPAMRGQLWFAERKLLYETVRRYRPRHCFEIGTWKGGGSTLFIAQGLHDNGNGTLHTVEVAKAYHDEAVANYSGYLKHLLPHVAFHIGDYRTVFAKALAEVGKADLILLDGAEDAQQSLEQYQFFLPFCQTGTVLLAHDWFTEKASLVRPLLERDWEILSVLGPPKSLGFAVALRR